MQDERTPTVGVCGYCGANDVALNEDGDCVHCEAATIASEIAAAEAALSMLAPSIDQALEHVSVDDLRALLAARVTARRDSGADAARTLRQLAEANDRSYLRRYRVTLVDEQIADLEQQFQPGGGR